MQVVTDYKIVANCQFATKNSTKVNYKCKHADIIFADAGMYMHYIYGEPFRIDFTVCGKTYTTTELKDLHRLFKIIKNDLHEIQVNDKIKKEVYLIVYTWNLAKEVASFFEKDPLIPGEVIVDDTILFRDVRGLVSVGCIEDLATDWFKLPSSNYMPSHLFAKFCGEAYEEYSIKDGPTGKIFKTAAQMAKYELGNKAPKSIKSYINHVVPYPDVYDFLRYHCFRASLCTNNGKDIFNNVTSYDQSSAHAHKLVTKIFPISKPVKAAMNKSIEWYFENKWCWFTATFTGVTRKDGFRHIDPFKVKRNSTISLDMSLVQLEAFELCYDYETVEFSNIVIADKGYLPDWIRCATADMFLEKAAHKVKDAHRNSIKIKLNAGSYGIHVERVYDYYVNVYDENGNVIGQEPRKYSNSDWADVWKDRYMPPQVGITITDYVFLDEVRIIAANPWLFAYCDTDSIKFTYNEYTMDAINKRNNESHEEIKAFCEQFGYDYNLMSELGEYKIDGKYRRFKSPCPKEYMYETEDGKLGAVTAGFAAHYDVKDLDTDYEFEKDRIPVILYEPIKKGLDPFHCFSMNYEYTDYKWIWYAKSNVKVREEFTLTIKQNAILENEMSHRYES